MLKKKEAKKKSPKAPKIIDPPEIYYDYLYDIKKYWTKYGIPISFIDPKTKFRVEGLLYSPKKRKRDSKSGTINVYYNFDGIYLQQPVEIDFKDILPSKRNLTKMENVEEAPKIIDTKIIEKYSEGDIKEKISYINIKKVYDSYRGINWTLPELLSILERNLDDLETISKLPFMKKVSKRSCRITNEVLETYTIEGPEPLEEKDNKYSIDKLEKEYKDCIRCSLSNTRISNNYQVVFGRGNKVNPKIFVIGEAPGTIERDTGITFNPSAPAGGVLSKVMAAAGISQEADCYLTNSVLCWPPSEDPTKKNGKPSEEHIGQCSSRLKTELAILKPKVILILGAIAYKSFFGRFLKGTITESVGWKESSENYKIFLSFHPSYIVRQLDYERDPEMIRKIKDDYLEHFKQIKKAIDE